MDTDANNLTNLEYSWIACIAIDSELAQCIMRIMIIHELPTLLTEEKKNSLVRILVNLRF